MSLETLRRSATAVYWFRGGVKRMKSPGSAHQILEEFRQTLIQRLHDYSLTLRSVPQNEKELECEVLWRVVDEIQSHNLDVRRHPWGRMELEEQWAQVKKEHCAYGFGMRHTADMYVLTREGQHGIAIDVKLAKRKHGDDVRPNAELQTLIGQCMLQRVRHDYAIGVFAHLMPLEKKFEHDDTNRLEEHLAAQQVYLVRLDFSGLA